MSIKDIFKSFAKKKLVGYPALPFPNYGSVLQAIAIYNLVKKLGYECRLINQSAFINNPEPSKEEIAKLGLDEAGSAKSPAPMSPKDRKDLENKVMRHRFQNFCKRIFQYDEKLANLPTGKAEDYELVKNYDAFICGSDQVWNPQPGWFKPVNYLQFAPRNKRVSYAPSLGQSKVAFSKQRNMPLWKHYLSEMSFLSAREIPSAKQIEKLTGRKVSVVLDPTLLFSADEWLEMAPEGALPDTFTDYLRNGEPYIIGYLLHGYREYKNAIEDYARKHNYKIAWLTGTDITLEEGFNRVETDPGGFLRLVKNARAICTDSFHGACFSIIFKKPFVSAIIGGMDKNAQVHDIRKYDLLERMGIPERAVRPDRLDILDAPIDYQIVDERLQTERQSSLAYLENALKTATSAKVNAKDLPVDIKLVPLPRKKRTIERVPLDDPLNCTGCGACVNICPVDAIRMEADEKGFLNPVVDDAKCVRCAKCLKQCPLRKRPELFRERTPHAYAAWSLDPEIILSSSSGGMFSVLANWVLEKNGVVYASEFNKKFDLETKRAENRAEMARMRGSKYVQGSAGMSYRKVRQDLEEDRYVLFAGTSCQIAGLYAYLQKDYPTLVTVDLFCAGVVSPLIFHKYINFREKQAGSKIDVINFRSKEKGWGYILNMLFQNGRKLSIPFDRDPYGMMFLNKFTIRTSCHRCVYKGLDNRWSDFTIGDFWGIGRKIPFEHPKSQGISAVMLNSIKARLIFEQLRETPLTIFSVERPIEEMLEGNPVITHRPPKPLMYNIIFSTIKESDFGNAYREWFGPDEIRETVPVQEEFKIK